MRGSRENRRQRWGMLACVAFAVCAMAVPGCAAEATAGYPDYYPEEFSGVGRILRVAENVIVIDDQQYILSPRITYRTLDQEYAFRSDFKPGMLVGYATGPKNEILSLYFLESGRR